MSLNKELLHLLYEISHLNSIPEIDAEFSKIKNHESIENQVQIIQAAEELQAYLHSIANESKQNENNDHLEASNRRYNVLLEAVDQGVLVFSTSNVVINLLKRYMVTFTSSV